MKDTMERRTEGGLAWSSVLLSISSQHDYTPHVNRGSISQAIWLGELSVHLLASVLGVHRIWFPHIARSMVGYVSDSHQYLSSPEGPQD